MIGRTVTVTDRPLQPATRRTGARAGYVAAVVVNLVLLVAVHSWWDRVPFLTDAFVDVLPWITVSLLASILVNTAYLAYDAAWFAALGQVVTLTVSIAATLRIYRVFPFDFSAYAFDWSTVTRAVLILAAVGAGIGLIVQLVTLVTALVGSDQRP